MKSDPILIRLIVFVEENQAYWPLVGLKWCSSKVPVKKVIGNWMKIMTLWGYYIFEREYFHVYGIYIDEILTKYVVLLYLCIKYFCHLKVLLGGAFI